MSQKLQCPQCGTLMEGDAAFCFQCGAKLMPVPEIPVVNNDAPQTAQPVEPQPVEQPAVQYASQPAPQPAPQPAVQCAPQPVPQYVPQYTAPYVPQPVPSKPTGGAWRAVLASFLTVLLAIFALAAGILGTIHTRISPDGVADTIRDVDLSEIDMSDFLKNAEEGDDVADYVYGLVDDAFIRDTGLRKRDVEKILNDSDLRDSLAGYLSDYAEAILNDERGEVLDGDDIMDLIRDNADLIESVIGYRLQKGDYAQIEEELDKFDFYQISPKKVEKALEENTPVKMDTIRFGLSATPWIIAGGLAVVMAVLIALVYWFRGRPVLGFCGGGLIASGTLLLLVALGCALLPGILQLSIVSELAKPLITTFLIHGGIQLVVGVVCAVVAGVMKPKKA